MKYLLLFLFTFPVFTQTMEDRVKTFDSPKNYYVYHDKFGKETGVRYMGDDHARWIGLGVFVGANGYEFKMMFGNNERMYVHDKVRFLLDGELLEVGETGIVSNNSSMIISPAHWDKISEAKIVEFQMFGDKGQCAVEIFGSKRLQAFKNLASLTK